MITKKPLDYFPHEEPVYGLLVHRTNHNLFSTACSDEKVLLYDTRQRVREEQGHRSIMSQVRYNHSRGVITSSRVENLVKLWSVEDIASRKEEEERRQDRRVYSHDMRKCGGSGS